MQRQTRTRRATFLLLPIVLALGACATKQELVASKLDRLAAAGFEARPANTTQRQALLAHLPPNHLVMRAVADRYVYLYADPLVCGCLYVGSQAAYNTYKQQMLQQQLADQQQLTAQMYSDPAWSFGAWGPWGAGWGPGFY